MNGAQFHLLLNHLPVLLPLVGTCILIYALSKKSRELLQVGLVLIVLTALATVPTYLSGAPAEQVVKNYPNVLRDAIHTHQDAAYLGMLLVEFYGLVCAIVLWRDWRRLRTTKGTQIFLIVFGLCTFILMARAAHFGGLIRHEELLSRSNGVQ
jgi:uncharacterized membrane protein